MISIKKHEMIRKEQALLGRTVSMPVTETHYVLFNSIVHCPMEMEVIIFGLGCFWGAERLFWQKPGVYATAVGYAGGYTPNPSYEEVCSGLTGHNEVVRVIYDPKLVSTSELLSLFWESHNPTQGMAQGNDKGTQYRSSIFYSNEQQHELARASKISYQLALSESDYGDITTEIKGKTEFYFAEDYHQQYLAKNPGGYCGLGGTGIKQKG